MNQARVLTASLMLSLSACAVGPELAVPSVELEASYLAEIDSSDFAPDGWWAALGDPVLVDLLARTSTSSPGLGAARARLLAARAERQTARSAFWPAIGLGSSYTRFEQSLESPGALGQLVAAGLAERDGEFYSANTDLNWELDLFGGLRRQDEAAAAALAAEVAALGGTELAFEAETAAAYFEFLGAESRIRSLTTNLDLLSQSADLARNRQRVGLGREVDALRAETSLAAAAARLPLLHAARDASLNRLAVLVGETPSLIRESVVAVPLPKTPPAIAVGTPADLLQRRPDIARSRSQLAQATAAIGIAQARFFPRLVLNASFGFESVAASGLGDSDARTSGLVPFLDWPILNGGRLRARYAVADADAAAAALAYEHTVLSALAETETALSDYAAARSTAIQLADAATKAREAALLARRLYDNGLTAFIDVLDAERSQTDLEDELAVAKTRTLLQLVQLYKALGGGWSVQTDP